MTPFVGLFSKQRKQTKELPVPRAVNMHKHTHKRTHILPPAYTHYAEAANWLETVWKRAREDGARLGNCLQLGNHRSKLKSQTEHAARRLLQSRRNQRSEQRHSEARQHLLPGRSCLLARIRLSLQHLLFLTTSCQKFSERQRSWLTNPRLTSCQSRRREEKRVGGRAMALVDSMCLPALNALACPAISVPVPVPWVKA